MIILPWLQNLVPPPSPPGPAPQPSTGGQTGGSGTPDDPAVIVVIGQRPTPGPPVGYGPFGGMTGAEARAARDMAWAMGTPEDRVRAMGLDPFASIDGTRDGDGFTEIGSVIAEMDFLNPALLALGIERVEISNRKAAHILSRHGLDLPNVSNFAPDLRNPLSLFTNVIAYGLQYPSIIQFRTGGNATNPNQPVKIDIYSQLPYTAGTDQFGQNTRWVKIVVDWMPGSNVANVVTAYPLSEEQARNRR